MDEFLDIYDKKNNPLGETKKRSEVHRDGDWHRTSHIYLVNNQGQFLVHLRSPLKDIKPNCWDTRFGGHVTAGKTYQETALEETKQELGLKVQASDLRLGPLVRQDDKTNKEFSQSYFYFFNDSISKLHFDDNEVVKVKWMSQDEIIKAMSKEPDRWAGAVEQFKEICNFELSKVRF